MSLPASRYGIAYQDILNAAQALQIGDRGTQSFTTALANTLIVEAEDLADGFVSTRVMVPLQPARAPGQATFDPTNITSRNYPRLFISGITYWASGLMLQSTFSENAPNTSEAGKWAIEIAQMYLSQFTDLITRGAGAGRIRNENPFVPPHLTRPTPKQA